VVGVVLMALSYKCFGQANEPPLAIREAPALTVIAYEVDGIPRFEFFDVTHLRAEEKRPIGVKYLSVYETGVDQPLWHVVSADQSIAGTITYGVVPRGFMQHVPRSGAPPELKKNGEYCVSSQGFMPGGTCFVFRGK
jgi:hypothetical protein